MCSGWATWGNSTRFGSGKSRAVPENSSSENGPWLMVSPLERRWGSLVLIGQVVVRVGPARRGGVEGHHRQQLWGGPGVAAGRGRAEQRGEACLHAPPEVVHVQPQEPPAAVAHVVAAGAVQLRRAAEVAVAEVAQPHRGLDQPLVELALLAVAL